MNTSTEASDVTPDEVEFALAGILADDKFAAAPQMSAFLAYVVKQSLLGEADRIKAYTVAVDALGKPPTFDPQNDPSVRVLAKRLRSSIDHYYERTDGHAVIIELKSGSYKPRFVRADVTEAPAIDADSAFLGAHPAEPVDARQRTFSTDATPGETTLVMTTGDGQNATATRSTNAASEPPSAPTGEAPGARAANSGTNDSGRTADWKSLRRRLPHPALVVITALAVGWGFTQHQQEMRLRDEIATIAGGELFDGDQPLRLALASSSDADRLRTRPELPTVYLPAMHVQDKLQGTLSASITRVLSRFDMIEVMRHEPTRAGQWPEEYELHFNDFSLGQRVRVEAQLLHAPTGRVVHVETFDLPDFANDQLTSAELAGIETFAARLAQPNGPLIRDYLSQSDLSPAVACALGVDQLPIDTASNSSPGIEDATGASETGKTVDAGSDADGAQTERILCDSSTASRSVDDAFDLSRQASALLDSSDAMMGPARKRSLHKASTLARRAVSHSPFSASAHATLMQTLQRQGKLDEALRHGNQSLDINRFDATTLRSVADLMDTMKRSGDGAALRAEAQRLEPDTGSAGLALQGS